MEKSKKGRKTKKGPGIGLIISGLLFVVVCVAAALLVMQILSKKAEFEASRVQLAKRIEEQQRKEALMPKPPRTLVDSSVEKTIKAADKLGFRPCPGSCLKLATPGWHRRKLKGFPDSYYWFTYTSNDHSKIMYFSQGHAGHIISKLRDIGPCEVCNGTGWVPKK